ncbi:myosuppressin [Copidosoma floridanum]|uniref:myosuppressin n=1 Tax=Copidosoma floridanum TaxID=29053 RepID=UPI0006C9A11D|nr:myosuppressin [Copidosoma floridanum]
MKYNSCAALALVCLVCVTELRIQALAALPPQCHPNKLHELPSRVTRVCMALLTIRDLGTSMEQYIMENAPMLSVDDLDALPQRDTMKRQDVDHVFLRFGKRR